MLGEPQLVPAAGRDAEYCLILPDDDLVYPAMLERTVRVLDAQPAGGDGARRASDVHRTRTTRCCCRA